MEATSFYSAERLEELESRVSLNDEEKTYWTKLETRRDEVTTPADYQKSIEFYIGELEDVTGIFGDRIAVERRLRYLIANTYERLGSFGLGESPTKGGDPMERSEILAKAMAWYQSADDVIGGYTEYALRQSESAAGAAHFRRRAGIDDEVTDALNLRRTRLLEMWASAMDAKSFSVINSDQKNHVSNIASQIGTLTLSSGPLQIFSISSDSHKYENN